MDDMGTTFIDGFIFQDFRDALNSKGVPESK
jgi:hypothetical protein